MGLVPDNESNLFRRSPDAEMSHSGETRPRLPGNNAVLAHIGLVVRETLSGYPL